MPTSTAVKFKLTRPSPYYPRRQYIPPQPAVKYSTKKIITKAKYWQDYYEHPDKIYEWKNGTVEEKGMSSEKTFVAYDWVNGLLHQYADVYPENKVYYLEFGFPVKLKKGGEGIYRPDIGVISRHNTNRLTGNSYHGVFDICIEAVSDSKKKYIRRDIKDKKDDYEKTGVKEYYTLYEQECYTEFYQLEAGKYVKMPRKDGIIRSKVLPGFQFRITDLYKQPNNKVMVNDPVYQGYVALDFQKERQRANLADKKAKAEAEKANLSDKKAKAEAERANLADEKAKMEAKRADENEVKLQQEKYDAVLRAFQVLGKNLETIAILTNLKEEVVKNILSQEGLL